MSNYIPTNNQLGIQPIAVTSTTQNHPLGTEIDAYDVTLGGGRFIYLKGVANTVAGTLVIYDQAGGTTTFAPNTAHLAQPLAVAMSANVASQYGWYQVVGSAVITKTATKVSPASQLFLSGTAGSVFSTTATGKQILNAISNNSATVASATTTVSAQIAWPFAQGQVI